MLGHHHVSDHDETVSNTDFLKDFEEQIPSAHRAKERTPMIRTECDEVQVSGAVITMQAPPAQRDRNGGSRRLSVTGEHSAGIRKSPPFENRKVPVLSEVEGVGHPQL
jgi:hypothetical protein